MIETWSQGRPDQNMSEAILVGMAGVIRRHPWWRARSALVLALLERLDVRPPARVIDVGCGWGVTLEVLERQGYQAVGVDISRRALERLDRPGRTLIEADLTQPLPGHAGPFDAVLALDVIEHLDDDRAAVARLGTLAKPGGVVVLAVPALPELFAEFDAVQGHRRRYLPETLRAACGDSGLVVEQVFWWGQWMVPLLKRQRGRSRARQGESALQTYRRYLRLPPWPIPWLFRLAYAAEQRRALTGRLRLGTSLFAVVRLEPTCPADR